MPSTVAEGTEDRSPTSSSPRCGALSTNCIASQSEMRGRRAAGPVIIGWAAVRLLGHLQQELMAPLRAMRILGHDLLEEFRDVVEPRVLGVADILSVVVSGLQRMVLHRNKVVGHVVEAGFPRCHNVLLGGISLLVVDRRHDDAV